MFYQVCASKNGLALTPPMGWNSWNHFGCNTDCKKDPHNCLSERLIMQMADAMVSSGMSKVGYEYINIDDCWLAPTRSPQGLLQPDPTRFPSGIKRLADYVHSKGLKFGIYEDVGSRTCGGFPGSEGNESVDAKTFASWGVDYLKMDGCYYPVCAMEDIYTEWSNLLATSGRPIVFSCSWPAYARNRNISFEYVASICNLWREYDDIRDEWASVISILNYQESKKLAPYAGPGNWNDPDMLEVGNGGMTFNEYKSHFSLWAMLAAPLIAGNDLRNMSRETLTILLNKEVIDIDQDRLGKQGIRISRQGGNEIWVRELADRRSRAVVLFNTNNQTTLISVTWAQVGLPSARAKVRDLWLHKDLGTFQTSFSSSVPPHGVTMILATAV
jgi:hypothetical protein